MSAPVDLHEGFQPDPELDPAETHVGPFLRRVDERGLAIGLVVASRHCNEHGALHGGVQMALADYTVGATARHGTEDSTVTVSFDAQFVDTAREGDLVVGRAEVVRRTGSLVFVQGRLTCAGRPLLAFNGVVKRMRPTAEVSPVATRP
ncbi:MAG: PaaI family thioesterase [Acidimicrobiales bacterium]|nr:PaaI family thioesterase [Acidimicrobiales bacterium]